MPKTIAALLLTIAASSLLSLASGAEYLADALPGGLPLGNALTALGLCAVAGAAIGFSARGTALRTVSLASLVAAAAWLPVSIALAGNLELNFDGERGLVWLIFSLAVVAVVFVSLVWSLVATLLAKRAGTA